MSFYVISDIHGNYEEFQKLLSAVGFNIKEDYLICLGDMIDRGPQSMEVVEWFRNANTESGGKVISLLGNHELMFLSYLSGNLSHEDYCSKFVGGASTLSSYSNADEETLHEHMRFIAALPKCLEIGNIILTHAGYDPSLSTDEQDISITCWGEDKIYTKDTSHINKTIIYGHTQTKYIYEMYGLKGDTIWKNGNQIGIDCGHRYSKKLLLYNVLTGEEHYYDFKKKRVL